MDLEADRARYEADRAKDLDLSRTHGIDAVMKANNLDALMFPGTSGTGIVDKAGYPSLVVPFGTIPNAPQATPNAPNAAPAAFPPGSTRSPRPMA